MPKMQRWIAVLAVLLAATGATLVNGSPAYAAACSGIGCNHQDPDRLGCGADARTLEARNPEGAYDLELRMSPTCNAAWARITNTGSGYPIYKYLTLQVWNAPSGGTMLFKEVLYLPQIDNDSSYWTKMGSYTYWVQACVKKPSGDGPCTARR